MRAIRASVLTALLLVFAPLGACDASSGPLGSGDNVHVDVDASSQPPPPTDDASADSPFAPLDGPYGVLPDGYAPLAVCAQCACGPGTYCYGGTPYTSLSSCDQTAAAGTPLQPGCHAMPSGCAAAPDDCVCLLQALNLGAGCYPVCTRAGGGGAADGGVDAALDAGAGGLTVYCPM